MELAGSLLWAGKVSPLARRQQAMADLVQSTWQEYATWLEV